MRGKGLEQNVLGNKDLEKTWLQTVVSREAPSPGFSRCPSTALPWELLQEAFSLPWPGSSSGFSNPSRSVRGHPGSQPLAGVIRVPHWLRATLAQLCCGLGAEAKTAAPMGFF